MKAWMEHTDEKDSDCLWLQAELEERLFFTFNLTIFLERAVNFCKLHSCSCLQPGTCSGVQDFIPSWSTSVCAQEGKKNLAVESVLWCVFVYSCASNKKCQAAKMYLLYGCIRAANISDKNKKKISCVATAVINGNVLMEAVTSVPEFSLFFVFCMRYWYCSG